MPQPSTSGSSRVYLVGAGPGDPGLITLRGVECLRRADVVLYDYLVNPQILEHASHQAVLVCLGRHGQGRIMSQEAVNERLVAEARSGKTVVRLKGGDPAIFARAAEEIAALVAAGITFEVVPGITAALAAASYAGVPLTHRDAASAVALITGHECDKRLPALDYAALAAFPGTLVFYMGVTSAERWTASLIEAGKPAATPALIIRRCSWPDQQTVRCTLGTVAEEVAEHQLRPPAMVVVGEAAGAKPAASWFTNRPLFGTTVVVTRPAGQCEPLRSRFCELGAEVVVQPAIEIGPPASWEAVDRVLTHLDRFDWLVFSSANGVDYLLGRLLAAHGDLRKLAGIRLAAIGPGTADALAAYHLRADLIPAEYRAEALAEALADAAAKQQVLLVRASRGREVLAERLQAAGVPVEQVVAYESRDVTAPDPAVAERLRNGEIDWVTVSSSAIARSLAALFGRDLRHTRLASISPVTSATLRELGLAPATEASEYTMEGLVEAILRWPSQHA
ncbi:MAG TPA: uroporphyrinogen-III C-methyltransferase [Pirellulales bacterium]|nr:uroporphyrinogen-III C-methyltransferase [Pirellulales bacterium]